MRRVCQAPDCDLILVSERQWKKIPLADRPAGHSGHGGAGLCSKHYNRLARRGTLERTLRTNAEVLEDYLMIRESCADVAEAAARMGMTEDALEGALYRARRRGNPEALPPPRQVERALALGKPYRAA